MGLETGVTYIEDMVETNPVKSTDDVAEGADHFHVVKTAVKGSFPNLGAAAVTKTAAEINDLATLTGSETLTNKTLTSPVINGGLQLQPVVNPSSGSSIDFSSVPSWVKRITINMFDLGTDSTEVLLLHIGDSGGLETSLYSNAMAYITLTPSVGLESSNNHIRVSEIISSTQKVYGAVVLTMLDAATNTWVFSGNTGVNSTLDIHNSIAGGKSLTGVLDRFSLLLSGANNFNSGSVSVIYE